MAQKLLKTTKKKVVPKKAAERPSTASQKIVLVGTYKNKQLKWIKENGVYNYPVKDGDEFDAEGFDKIKELWLYADAHGTCHCFTAVFVGKMTSDEFLTAYPTYAKIGRAVSMKPPHKAYYVFKTSFLDYGPKLDNPQVIIRAMDFATGRGRTKGIKNAYDQFKQDGEFAPIAAYLPSEISQVPRQQLRVCEYAVQMDFFFTPVTESKESLSHSETIGLSCDISEDTVKYLTGVNIEPIFFCGDSLEVLRKMPEGCIDCCMTSPPYWNKRQYQNGGIGLELSYDDYINNLLAICAEVYRVLKPTGSFWLNIGDSYLDKNLLNIPSRVAIRMQDEQGWILRNTIIWNKVKGCPDNSLDKLRNIYEPIFHFVKQPTGYYYDIDLVRNKPHSSKVVNGAVVSATGVSGIRYKRKIELSTVLTAEQKSNANKELSAILEKVKCGEVSDFRMIIRGEQRTTHSDSEEVSGRAKELHEKGFYFLKYNPKGSKPSDLWDIIPEDSQGREMHFAPYPEDLCVAPLKLTCPQGGIVLDPFSGTGTTMKVARLLGVKSIGIDISQTYIDEAKERIARAFAQGDLFEGGNQS